MITFIVRRLLLALPVLFGASLALFVLLYVLPGDPASLDSATVQRPRNLRRCAIDLTSISRCRCSICCGLTGWCAAIWRKSLVSGYPVARLIGQRLPVAIELTLGALFVSLLIGVPAGIAVGVRPRGWLARAIDGSRITAIAVPVFWLGLLLQIIVAIKLGWLPAGVLRRIVD